jgi:hypothetical protein
MSLRKYKFGDSGAAQRCEQTSMTGRATSDPAKSGATTVPKALRHQFGLPGAFFSARRLTARVQQSVRR